MMKPEVMAKASNYVYFANGNEASQEFLQEDVIGDPASYPTPAALEPLYTLPSYEQRGQRVVTRLSLKVRRGHWVRHPAPPPQRSDNRTGGKACVSALRSRSQ